SGLYRVFYNGEDKVKSGSQKDIVLTEEQQLRRKLESYSMGETADMDLLWSSLGHPDRRIRYAARVSLEYQDTATIEARLASETDPTTVIQATIALARIGKQESQDKALDKLISLTFTDLSENLKNDYIRACDLLFIRGEFKGDAKNKLTQKLSPLYPTPSNQVNRELVQLLAYLEDPTVVGKTMALLDDISNIEKNTPVLDKDVTERSEQYGGTIERMKTN